MNPHPTTLNPSTDPNPGWSLPVTAPLAGLVDWSPDFYECWACHWTCEPVTRPVLGDQWGGFCAFHLGVIRGAQHATDWDPIEDHPGWLGWRYAARVVARLLLNASFGDYIRGARRARRARAAERNGR
jgi:hypothetical protein